MARILIVDDEAANRLLVRAILEGDPHEVIEAESGERAIEVATRSPPDLVLCDVMMTGMNGFETTKRLKELAGKAFLPVILVTGLTDPSSRHLGLRVGADEFLTKPLDRVELKVRVGNLLALRQNEQALARMNRELIDLHHLKDEMASMIVHDLKNPLSVMMASFDYIGEMAEGGDPEIAASVRDGLSAGRRVTRLLSNLVDVTRMESGRFEPKRVELDVSKLLAPVVEQRATLARSLGLALDGDFARTATASVDGDLLVRVVENLLDNALRHTPRLGRIEVTAFIDEERLEVRVGNSGPPIPPEVRTRMFEKYARGSSDRSQLNLGLGLYFCRLAAEAHGGTIRVDETAALTTVFRVALPRVPLPPRRLLASPRATN